MTTAVRLLELLRLLHVRAAWTCAELAQRLEVTERTVRRDVTRLRELGHPVEATRGPHGGYQLAPGDELPPLMLEDREALAVVLGLRLAASGGGTNVEEAAVAALAKLERVLPDRLREQIQDLAAATRILGRGPSATTDPDHLVALAQACRRRHRVRFAYRARDGAASYRHVEPLQLVHAYGRWYLVAFDLERDDWRTFRVDRASSPLATGVPCTERTAPDPEILVRDALTGGTATLHAELRLHVPVHEAERFVSSGWGELERDGEATTRLRVRGTDEEELARWLGLLPCSFDVIEPTSLRDALHRHARRLLATATVASPGR